MQSEFPCEQCGGKLAFEPGTTSIKCQYCGHVNAVPESSDEDRAAAVHEQDLEATLASLRNAETSADVEETKTLKCDSCAAEFSWDESVSADNCPFCGSPIVTDPKTNRHIKPQALVPFQLNEQAAQEKLQKWLGSLWFAPNDVKRYAYTQGKLVGMYVPYWTYDAQTWSTYDGERGIAYQEPYTTRDSDGNTVTRYRTRIDWTPVSGSVDRFFDDVLVLASGSLPQKYALRLKDWDLQKLEPYRDQYLAGYRSEVYQVDLENGYARAREHMEKVIYKDVTYDIGGDRQRVHHINSRYEDLRFKHILLPVWMNAYRYGGKSYNFLVNGQTGEVQGARPWSWVKIGIAVVIGLVVVGAIAYVATLKG